MTQLAMQPHFMIRHTGVDLTKHRFPLGSVIHDIPWDATEEKDAWLTAGLCSRYGIKAGVLDHYRLSAYYQTILSTAGLRWMQFGNPLQTHPLLGALIHEATPGSNDGNYASREMNPEARFLRGPAHALLAPEFHSLRRQARSAAEQKISSILLTLGGGNDRGMTLKALSWLDAAGFDGRRVILTSGMNPSLTKLQAAAAASSQIELHVDNWQPAAVMASCDLAICAGGTSLHELACLGVTPVIVSIADNQRFPGMAWEAAGMGHYLGSAETLDEQAVIRSLQDLLGDPGRCLDMAARGRRAQDGLGACRVALALGELGGLSRIDLAVA